MAALDGEGDRARVALRRSDLDPDPLAQFRRWYEDWHSSGVDTPEAVVVSTVSSDGVPSSRFVLLREFNSGGFVFFTNINSRKGRELADNQNTALCFGWLAHHRQVRVVGRAEIVDSAAADQYWASRPRASRVAASISDQSEPIADRGALERRVADLSARLGDDGDVPRPDHWAGVRVVPHEIEFWQGRDHRLHDRFAYTRHHVDDPWTITRLMP